MLALGLGAFALWFLLFAPTLQHNAQVSPVGTRRTVSLDIVGPVAALSRALQLSHIVSATGRSNRLPGGTLGITVSGPPPVPAHHGPRPAHGGGPIPPTPSTVPPNPKLPTAAKPLRVLIVGDSLGLDMGGPLQDDLANTGVVNATLDARESTGLTRPDYFNWPAELDLRPEGGAAPGGGDHDRGQRRPGLPRAARRALHLPAVEHLVRPAGGAVHADGPERGRHRHLGRHAAHAEPGPQREMADIDAWTSTRRRWRTRR